jgi:predicted HNH restriction endonuclease
VIKEILRELPDGKLATEVVSMFSTSNSWKIEFTRKCREKIESSLLEYVEEIDTLHGENNTEEDVDMDESVSDEDGGETSSDEEDDGDGDELSDGSASD